MMSFFVRQSLKHIKNLARIVHAARIHISLVYAIAAFLFVRSGGVTIEELVAVLAFTACVFATYLFNRAMDAESDKRSQPGEVLKGRAVVISSLVFFFAPILFLVAFSLPVVPYAAFILIGILYSIPVYKGRALRCLFLFKNLYAALAWWISFVILHSIYAGLATFPEALASTIDILLLILAIEIMWDVRDTHADKAACVDTLPNTIGIAGTRVVLALLLLSVLFIREITLGDPLMWAAVTLLLLSAMITPNTPRWIFHGFIYVLVTALLTTLLFV